MDDTFSNLSRNCNYFKPVIHEKIGIEHQPLKIIYVWGHSNELFDSKKQSLQDFELICQQISSQNDVWSTTPSKVVSYFHNLQQLIKTKYEIANPKENTSTIWFTFKNKDYKIKPGETFHLKEI